MLADSMKPPSGPGSRRDRRPAVWPWLLMPLVVLIVFYILYNLHRLPHSTPAAAEPVPAETAEAPAEGGATAPADSGPR